MNEALWIQMLATMIAIFFYNIFTMFGLYRLVMSYSSQLRSTLFSRLLWNSAYLLLLTILACIGEMIKCKAAALLSMIQMLIADQTVSWSFVDAVSSIF